MSLVQRLARQMEAMVFDESKGTVVCDRNELQEAAKSIIRTVHVSYGGYGQARIDAEIHAGMRHHVGLISAHAAQQRRRRTQCLPPAPLPRSTDDSRRSRDARPLDMDYSLSSKKDLREINEMWSGV